MSELHTIHVFGQAYGLSAKHLEDLMRESASILGYRLVRQPPGSEPTHYSDISSAQALSVLQKMRRGKPVSFKCRSLAVAYKCEYYGLVSCGAGGVFLLTEAGDRFKEMWRQLDEEQAEVQKDARVLRREGG